MIDNGILTRWSQTRGIFQVFTDSGPRIVLPATYVNDMRQNPSLSFTEFVREVNSPPIVQPFPPYNSCLIVQDFMADYPAFQAFHAGVKDEVFQEAVRNQLIQSLGRVLPILLDIPRCSQPSQQKRPEQSQKRHPWF